MRTLYACPMAGNSINVHSNESRNATRPTASDQYFSEIGVGSICPGALTGTDKTSQVLLVCCIARATPFLVQTSRKLFENSGWNSESREYRRGNTKHDSDIISVESRSPKGAKSSTLLSEPCGVRKGLKTGGHLDSEGGQLEQKRSSPLPLKESRACSYSKARLALKPAEETGASENRVLRRHERPVFTGLRCSIAFPEVRRAAGRTKGTQ